MQSWMLLAVVAAGAIAAPTADQTVKNVAAVRAISPCETQYSYNVTSETVADDPPQLVTGFSCTSLPGAECSLTKSATYSKTVTTTVGGGLSGSLELTSIFTAGADAGFSYSWSTSDATGTSASVDCPAGGFECGLQAVTTMVHTNGTVEQYFSGDACLNQQAQTQSYGVVAPQTVPNVPADQAVVMDFKACLASCTGSTCAQAVAAGLGPCP